MSGYLEGLVARAGGTPSPATSAVRARRPPRAWPGGGPAVDETAATDRGLGAAGAAAPAPATAPADDRAETSVEEPHVTAPLAPRTAADALASAPPAVTAAAPGPVTTPAVGESLAEPALRADQSAPERVALRPHEPEREPGESVPSSPPAAVRLRPSAAPETATPSTASEPRIEVHIGRVEVRKPPVPDPPQWSPSDATPTRPAPRGFGELAAARRHLDRLAR